MPVDQKRKIDMSNLNAPLVLCVDGEYAALQVRSLLLSSAGYRVVTARNGGDALQILQLNPVDLVIIDLWQPGGTAPMAAKEIKRVHPKVRVILLSGLMDPPMGAEEADLVLTKGITPLEFLEAIRSVVDKGLTRNKMAKDETIS